MRSLDQVLVPLTHYGASPFTFVSQVSFMWAVEHKSNHFILFFFFYCFQVGVGEDAWRLVGRKRIGRIKIDWTSTTMFQAGPMIGSLHTISSNQYWLKSFSNRYSTVSEQSGWLWPLTTSRLCSWGLPECGPQGNRLTEQLTQVKQLARRDQDHLQGWPMTKSVLFPAIWWTLQKKVSTQSWAIIILKGRYSDVI